MGFDSKFKSGPDFPALLGRERLFLDEREKERERDYSWMKQRERERERLFLDEREKERERDYSWMKQREIMGTRQSIFPGPSPHSLSPRRFARIRTLHRAPPN